ncbi:MAG: hypothetical protein KBD00_03355 [Candidatus Peribacteraceae bacterium]|nr:hypothetical protein [Candidatus Peribacteraceae bacterium]
MPTAAQVADPFGLAETKRKARKAEKNMSPTVDFVLPDGETKHIGLPDGTIIKINGEQVWPQLTVEGAPRNPEPGPDGLELGDEKLAIGAQGYPC